MNMMNAEFPSVLGFAKENKKDVIYPKLNH